MMMMMEAVCTDSTDHDTGLERTITVLRGTGGLGMTVSALKDGLGVVVRSVVIGGAVGRDGRLKVGDGILAINGEPTANLTNARARAMLRRHSLTGPELRVTYVPNGFLEAYQTLRSRHGQHTADSPDSPDSPDTPTLPRSGGRTKKTEEQRVAPDGQPSLQDGDQTKRVTLIKTGGESFGIGVIGGRGIGHRLGTGEMSRGVFIKRVAEGGPAARGDSVRPGDRILQVGGVDVSDLTHEEAAEAIRRAGDRVELLVRTPQRREDRVGVRESSSERYVPAPFKLSGNCLLKPPPHPVPPPPGNPREGRPPETSQLGKRGRVSYLSHVLQEYGGLPGELKMVELDCAAHARGLGLRVTSRNKTPWKQALTGSAVEEGPSRPETSSRPHVSDMSGAGLPSSSCCPSCSSRPDPRTCPVIPGCVNTVDICRGPSGLGLTIVGGCNTLQGAIVIHELNEGGAAQRDGRLMPGDHILEVNGVDLTTATHEEALSVLRLTARCVRISVYRPPWTDRTPAVHEDMWDLFAVDLHPRAGRELGLGIVGKRDDGGVFVSEIVAGGAAGAVGRLTLGDQILSVNGEDVRAASPDHARTLLQNCGASVALEVARFRATPRYTYQFQRATSEDGASAI